MRFTIILSALGLSAALAAGAAMASDDHGERRHRDGSAEHSRSHDEASEHASRRDGRRHHDDRQHDSRDRDTSDDNRGDRSKPRSDRRS